MSSVTKPPLPRFARGLLTVSAIVLVTSALVAVLVRIPYGVDLTDESFYIAIPYRFVLGDRPFVDEASMAQLAGLLAYPLVWLYVKLHGSSDGIVLFTRLAYLTFTIGVSAVAAGALSFVTRWQIALVICAICFTYVPWSIANLSYNTLGSGLFTAGALLGALSTVRRGHRVHTFVGGVVHALAVFAYPPMALGVLAYALVLVVVTREALRQAWLPYAAGCLATSLSCAAVILSFGLDNVRRAFEFSTSLGAQGGGTPKITQLRLDLWEGLIHEWELVAVVVVLCALEGFPRSRCGWARVTAALLLPLAVLPVSGFENVSLAQGIMLYVGLAGIPLLWWKRWSQEMRRFLLALCVPSFVACAVIGYASGNGFRNAGLGAAPAALGTLLGLVSIVDGCAGASRDGSRAKPSAQTLLSLLPPALVVTLLLVAYLGSVYRDAPVHNLRAQIGDGPFRGLWTEPAKASVLSDLRRDVLRLARPTDRVLFYYDFPGGYLLSGLRPATNTAWLFDPVYLPSAEPWLPAYYERERILPTLVVRRLRDGPSPEPVRVVDAYIRRQGCQPLLETRRYAICRVPPVQP